MSKELDWLSFQFTHLAYQYGNGSVGGGGGGLKNQRPPLLGYNYCAWSELNTFTLDLIEVCVCDHAAIL